MKNIGYPVEFSRLNDTVTADGPVNYFSFAECFSELLDAGNIVSVNDSGTEGFKITEQGINVVDNLLDTLIPSVQRTALAAATRLTSFDKSGAKIEHELEKLPDGKYLFTFRVSERDARVFSLELILESKEQVERIEFNLNRNPDAVYKSIMAMLTGQANYLLE